MERESGSSVKVERDSVYKDIAIMTMNRKPKNFLNKGFLTELNATLEKLENDDSYRGVILTSPFPGVFVAGLDGASEFYKTTLESQRSFWTALQDFWMRLYGTKLATVAAMNGSAFGGGLMVAMSCDYRIMAQGDFNTGLSEVRVGLAAPIWFQEVMAKIIGERETDLALQLGKRYTPEEALKVGLVDETAPLEELLNNAREELAKWLKIPEHARVKVKQMRREPLVEKLRARQEDDTAFFIEFLNRDIVQKHLGAYLASVQAQAKTEGAKI